MNTITNLFGNNTAATTENATTTYTKYELVEMKKKNGTLSAPLYAQLQMASLKYYIAEANGDTMEEVLLTAYEDSKNKESNTTLKMLEVEADYKEAVDNRDKRTYNATTLNIVSILILMVGHVAAKKMDAKSKLTVCLKALTDRNQAVNDKAELVKQAMTEAVESAPKSKIKVKLANL